MSEDTSHENMQIRDSHQPTCVGFIMDGNRRWAKARGESTLAGHTAGRDTLKACVDWLQEKGIYHAVFYAFSTENWRRAEDEVGHLMGLARGTFEQDFEEIKEKNIRLRFVGDLSRFPEDIQKLMQKSETETKENTSGTVALAMSYGGRAEIVSAVNALVRDRKQEITEDDLKSYFWSHDIPDPDMIIRTGGQQRLSNFLTWQSVYSELFFTDTLWPDFSKEEFEKMLDEFAHRKRNFGK